MAETAPEPKTLIIFFHGHGSNRSDAESIVAPTLRQALPDVDIIFPQGPIQWTSVNGLHCSWFNVGDMPEDNPDPHLAAERALAAAADVNRAIDDLLAARGLRDENIILAGFSQGATMAYYTALTRKNPVAGVFSLSGGALDELTDPVSKPPVALHAGQKETHPYCGVPQVAKTHILLEQKGFTVDCIIFPDTRHVISQEAIDHLATFTKVVTSPAFRAAHPQPEPVNPAVIQRTISNVKNPGRN